jgi:diacylglycerol kinase (ATP)
MRKIDNMAETETEMPRKPPGRVSGLGHLFAAGSYSIGGLRRLWRETAFRHELLFSAVGIGLLIAFGASPAWVAGFVVLNLALIAIEALNTAIECLVDHVSPDWAEFARDAKDLGSLAVACLIAANVVCFVAALLL